MSSPKRLPLSCHRNSSQIFDATKHTIPPTYNTKQLISNISETHRFSPQMRLIAYPDHKTTLKENYFWNICVGKYEHGLYINLKIVIYNTHLYYTRSTEVSMLFHLIVKGIDKLFHNTENMKT